MIRAVYAEMLGHDASFAYIHAVKLTHEKNLFAKRSQPLEQKLHLSLCTFCEKFGCESVFAFQLYN
jgi:hypothetical protein